MSRSNFTWSVPPQYARLVETNVKHRPTFDNYMKFRAVCQITYDNLVQVETMWFETQQLVQRAQKLPPPLPDDLLRLLPALLAKKQELIEWLVWNWSFLRELEATLDLLVVTTQSPSRRIWSCFRFP